MHRIILSGVFLACTTVLAPAQDFPTLRLSPDHRIKVASVDRGLVVARRMCSECHAIERGRHTSPNAEAPPFQNIADTPGMSAAALQAFFNTPHRMMPNLVIEHDEAVDLVDYVLSLRLK